MTHPFPTASRRERRLRPTPLLVAALVVVLLALRATGAGATRVSFAIVMVGVTLVVLDVVVAVWHTRLVRLAAAAHPTSVVSGDQFAVDVTIAGPALPVTLALSSQPESVRLAAEAPRSGRLPATASGRGVIVNLTVLVRSDGVCGLAGCERVHRVTLPHPLVIGPRPVESETLPELAGRWGEGEAAAAQDGDLVRAVRPYVPGDRLRQVHWRATAKAGELVVKETEETLGPLLHLVLDLGEGGAGAEAAAGRAAWYAGEAKRRGYRILLTTNDDGRPLTALVPTFDELNRRLARAAPGRAQVSLVPEGSRYLLVVSDQGDRWP